MSVKASCSPEAHPFFCCVRNNRSAEGRQPRTARCVAKKADTVSLAGLPESRDARRYSERRRRPCLHFGARTRRFCVGASPRVDAVQVKAVVVRYCLVRCHRTANPPQGNQPNAFTLFVSRRLGRSGPIVKSDPASGGVTKGKYTRVETTPHCLLQQH